MIVILILYETDEKGTGSQLARSAKRLFKARLPVVVPGREGSPHATCTNFRRTRQHEARRPRCYSCAILLDRHGSHSIAGKHNYWVESSVYHSSDLTEVQ
jgi:hypothetical protein